MLKKNILLLFVVGLLCNICLPQHAHAADEAYGGGSGTILDPYLIYTAENLQKIGKNQDDWDKHFKLMSDIDMKKFTGTKFNIIGRSATNAFTGVFDGNQKVIINFNYKTATANEYVGLFGVVGDLVDGGLIFDLGFVDVDLDAINASAVGSLVGFLQKGTIERCFVSSGIVSNTDFVGGLVGANSGSIFQSYAACKVLGNVQVGGFVGSQQAGLIQNCYSQGNVTGEDFVGGFAGDQFEFSSLINCYSSGKVNAFALVTNNFGGLVGTNEGEIIDCYWDKQKSDFDNMCGTQPNDGVGCKNSNGQSTNKMQLEDTFENWNFDSPIWTIDDDFLYPQLWWDATNLTTISFDLTPQQLINPVTSDASGDGRLILNTDTQELTWDIDLSDLTDGDGSVSSAHFFGPAESGQTASSQVDILTNSQSLTDLSSVSPVQLTTTQSNEILGGLWYAQISTTAFGDGELRGQVNRDETITLDAVAVKAGKSRDIPQDSVKIEGKLYSSIQKANVDDLVFAQDMCVIVNNVDPNNNIVTTILTDQFTLNTNPDTLRNSQKFSYKRDKNSNGPIEKMSIDFTLNTFEISGKKISLSGLQLPFSVTIKFGIYSGVGMVDDANAEIVNKGKPLPICLLSGSADAVSIDKAKVKSGKKGDSLNASGGLSAAQAVDFTAEALTVKWGGFTEVIPAGNFTNKKGQKFSYKKPKEGAGAISKMDIDLDKCSIKLSIKDATSLDKEGNVLFEISSDNFSATDTIIF